MDDFQSDEGYEEAPTRSSIAAPLLRALLFAALAFGIYALIFGDATDDDIVALDEATATPTTVTTPSPTPTAAPLDGMPSATEVPLTTPTATPEATGTESTGTEAAGQVGAGVSVQVIAGAGTTAEQFDAAVAALRELGYEVTESGVSPNAYPQTTVFATPGEEAQAEALVAADERFTTFEPEFPDLNEQIQIHVLVGEDWPT